MKLFHIHSSRVYNLYKHHSYPIKSNVTNMQYNKTACMNMTYESFYNTTLNIDIYFLNKLNVNKRQKSWECFISITINVIYYIYYIIYNTSYLYICIIGKTRG
jgi:hypothetical protein